MQDSRHGNLPRVARGTAPVYINEKLIRRACGDTKISLSRIRRLVLKGGVTIRGTLRKLDFGTCTGRLESLEQLDVGNNEIIHIEQLEQFRGILRELSLANNKISRIKNLSPVATTLEVLNLNGNTITRIPTAISELRCLRVLGLAKNRLTVLDDFKRLAKLPALAQLEVRDNPVTQTASARDFVVFTLPSLDMLDRRLLTQRDRDAAMKRFGAATNARVEDLEKQLAEHKRKEAMLERELKEKDVESSKALRAALERTRSKHAAKEQELEEQAKVTQRLLDLKSQQLTRAEEVVAGLDLHTVDQLNFGGAGQPVVSTILQSRKGSRMGEHAHRQSLPDDENSSGRQGSPGPSQQLFSNQDPDPVVESSEPGDSARRNATDSLPKPADLPNLLRTEYRESRKWQKEMSEVQLQLLDVEQQIASIARGVIASLTAVPVPEDTDDSSATPSSTTGASSSDSDSDSTSSGDVTARRASGRKSLHGRTQRHLVRRSMRHSWAKSRQRLLATAVAAQDACDNNALAEIRRKEVAFRLTAAATVASLRARRTALAARFSSTDKDTSELHAAFRSKFAEAEDTAADGAPTLRQILEADVESLSGELGDIRRQLRELAEQSDSLEEAASSFEVPDVYDKRLDVQSPQRKKLARLQEERSQLVAQSRLVSSHLVKHISTSTQLEVFMAILGIPFDLEVAAGAGSGGDDDDVDSTSATLFTTTEASEDDVDGSTIGWTMADLAAARAKEHGPRRGADDDDHEPPAPDISTRLFRSPQPPNAPEADSLDGSMHGDDQSQHFQKFADDTIGNTLDVTEFSAMDHSLSTSTGLQGEWAQVVGAIVAKLTNGHGDVQNTSRLSGKEAMIAAASASAARVRRGGKLAPPPIHHDKELRQQVVNLPELGRKRLEQLLYVLQGLGRDGLLGEAASREYDDDRDVDGRSGDYSAAQGPPSPEVVHAEVQKLQHAKDETARRQKKLESLLLQEQELKTRVALLETRAAAARDARQRDVAAASNARRELLAMVARQRDVHSEFTELNPKMRVAREQLTEVARLVLDKERHRSNLDDAIAELEDRRRKMQQQVSDLEIKAEETRQMVNDQERTQSQYLHGEEEASQLRIDLQHLRAAKSKFEADIDEMKASELQKINELKRRSTALQQQEHAQVSAAEGAVAQLQEQQSELRDNVDMLSRSVKELYARREAALQALNRDEAQVDRADIARAQTQDALRELNELESKVERLRASEHDLEPTLDAIGSAQKNLEDQTTLLREATLKLLHTQERCTEESSELLNVRRQLSEARDELKKETQALQAKKSALRKFSRQAASIADVGDRLREMERQRVLVTEHYSKAVERQHAMAKEFEATKQEVAKLEQRAAMALKNEELAAERANQARAHLKSIIKEADARKAETAAIKPQNEALKQQGDKMAQALQRLEAEHSSTLHKLQLLHKQTETATDSLAEAKEELRTGKLAHEAAVRELKLQKESAERELQRLQHDINVKKRERDDLDAEARAIAPRLRKDQEKHASAIRIPKLL